MIPDPTVTKVVVAFNYSSFKIQVPHKDTDQQEIRTALDVFYQTKAVEKIAPIVERIAVKTKLQYTSLTFRKMSKRWGSCTAGNKIILNTDAVKLPYSLIEYLITHELSHTKVKDHSKAFWRTLSRYAPNWKTLDARMQKMRM